MRLIEGSIASGKSALLPMQVVKKLLDDVWTTFTLMIRIEASDCQALLKLNLQ
jgi:hypothetical protein